MVKKALILLCCFVLDKRITSTIESIYALFLVEKKIIVIPLLFPHFLDLETNVVCGMLISCQRLGSTLNEQRDA